MFSPRRLEWTFSLAIELEETLTVRCWDAVTRGETPQVVAELWFPCRTRATMSDFDDREWNETWAWGEDHAYSTYQPLLQQVATQVTTKVPPSFAGRTSWFAFEEAVEDWCDLTELAPDKQAPALKQRPEG